jgi:hypothetical protein
LKIQRVLLLLINIIQHVDKNLLNKKKENSEKLRCKALNGMGGARQRGAGGGRGLASVTRGAAPAAREMRAL